MVTAVEQLYERIVSRLESPDAGELAQALHDMRSADIAEVMTLLEDEARSRILFALSPRAMAEVVVLLDEAVRGEVVEDLSETQIKDLVSKLPPDDAADVLGELSLEQFGEVIEQIPREQSDQITELLSYDEDSAGGIMNPRLLSLPVSATVAEAVEEVRAFAADEDLHYVYAVDDQEHLVGIVPLRRLVVNAPHTRLENICDRDPVKVTVGTDQEEVLHVIQKYDIAAVPVVDAGGVLVGRITYDDVMDVAAEEADEDIYRMAGTHPAELETHSAFRAARVRMGWLIPCIIGTGCAGGMIAWFHSSALTVTQFQALMMFVPMIAATSGNAGIQTSTIVLRGLATGELAATRMAWVFTREVRVAIFVGILCALITGGITVLLLIWLRRIEFEVAMPDDVRPALMGMAVSIGMLCAIGEAVALGIFLPFLFRRFGVDPAIAAGPLITSLNDLLSVTVYFTIALHILA